MLPGSFTIRTDGDLGWLYVLGSRRFRQFCTGNSCGKVWLCVFRWAATRPDTHGFEGDHEDRKRLCNEVFRDNIPLRHTTSIYIPIMDAYVPLYSHQLTSGGEILAPGHYKCLARRCAHHGAASCRQTLREIYMVTGAAE